MLKPKEFASNQLFFIPRPDRLFLPIRSAQLPAVDTDALQDILAEFGLTLSGNSKATAVRGRSDNLIVETFAGKKVLKRYMQTIAPESILHEHSILQYLAQTGFPAPRLTAARNGKTFVEKDQRCYALFDYLDGYFHYHNYLFTPAWTSQFIAASAEALATLHAVLKDFAPEGCNPNGFISRQGERWREVDWYEERLDQCRQIIHLQPVEIPWKFRRMFSRNVEWAENRLLDLDNILKTSAPPRLIIHGDFGPYNVFFKPGAPVTILDFELARLDWRLTDLSHAMYFFALGRVGFNFKKMACFLNAYQNVYPLDPHELELLPYVWQFLLIRRTIVCWHSYLHEQDHKWIREAERKIDLAHWIERNSKQLSIP